MNEESQQVPTRRIKLLMVNPTDFMVLFTKGLKVRGGWKIVKGLPTDAKLLGVAYEPARGGVMLVVESAEYEAIPQNITPPIQVVEIAINDPKVKKPKKKTKRNDKK